MFLWEKCNKKNRKKDIFQTLLIGCWFKDHWSEGIFKRRSGFKGSTAFFFLSTRIQKGIERSRSRDNPDFLKDRRNLKPTILFSFLSNGPCSKWGRIKPKEWEYRKRERESPGLRPWPLLSCTHRASAILSWDNPIEGVDRVSRSECGDLLLVYPTGHMRTDFFTNFFSSWLNEPVI